MSASLAMNKRIVVAAMTRKPAEEYLGNDITKWEMKQMSRDAVTNGHVSVLQWLNANGLLLFSSTNSRKPWWVASRNGHLNVLDWLAENRSAGEFLDSRAAIVEGGAHGGHISVLEWARDHGATLSRPRACVFAAYRGHLAALQWLLENGCPWDSSVFESARHGGNEHIVDWARANGYPEPENFE